MLHWCTLPLNYTTIRMTGVVDDLSEGRPPASCVCVCSVHRLASTFCVLVFCPKFSFCFLFGWNEKYTNNKHAGSGLLSGVGLAFLFGATSRVAAARDEGRPKENNRADPQKPKSPSALWLSEWIDAVHRLTFCAGKWLWGELWRRQRRQPNKENGIVWMISGQLVCYFGVRDMECNSIFQARQWAEKYEVATSYGVYGI